MLSHHEFSGYILPECRGCPQLELAVEAEDTENVTEGHFGQIIFNYLHRPQKQLRCIVPHCHIIVSQLKGLQHRVEVVSWHRLARRKHWCDVPLHYPIKSVARASICLRKGFQKYDTLIQGKCRDTLQQVGLD